MRATLPRNWNPYGKYLKDAYYIKLASKRGMTPSGVELLSKMRTQIAIDCGVRWQSIEDNQLMNPFMDEDAWLYMLSVAVAGKRKKISA